MTTAQELLSRHGAFGGDVIEVVMSIKTRAGQSDKQLAWLDRAAVDADAGDGHAEVARHEGTLGAADHVLDAQTRPACSPPPARTRSAVRAISRSSKSCDSVPMIW